MSWGYKILMLYAGFISMIITFVFISAGQTNEMQHDNYYAQELLYQQVVTGKENLKAINGKVNIEKDSKAIKVTLPSNAINAVSDAKITFLRPSSKKHDLKLDLLVDAKGEQYFPREQFILGYYSVKISWKNNGIIYYAEQPLNITE